MNLDIAKQWAAALRSGKYKQTQGALCKITPDGLSHCCLGVLCELAVEAGIKVERYPIPSHRIAFDVVTDWLPLSVQQWADLESRDPDIGSRTLSDLNDNDTDFYTIADLIEAHAKEL